MPRRKKQSPSIEKTAGTPGASGEANAATPAASAIAAAEPASERVAATAPAESTRPNPAEEPLASAVEPLENDRFHSWVTDRQSGYEQFTDKKANLLVVRFHRKPSDEILNQLKDAGFRYQPEYFGQQKVWTRRNDFEGRLRVEEIEASARNTGPAAGVPF